MYLYVSMIKWPETTTILRDGKPEKLGNDDNINPKFLKVNLDINASLIQRIIANFWNTYTLLTDRNVSVLVKVPQYRDLTKFNIWRRITLLLHVNQVLEPIMLNTLSHFLSPELVYEHDKIRSCSDPVNYMCIIYSWYNSTDYHSLCHLETAFKMLTFRFLIAAMILDSTYYIWAETPQNWILKDVEEVKDKSNSKRMLQEKDML